MNYDFNHHCVNSDNGYRDDDGGKGCLAGQDAPTLEFGKNLSVHSLFSYLLLEWEESTPSLT